MRRGGVTQCTASEALCMTRPQKSCRPSTSSSLSQSEAICSGAAAGVAIVECTHLRHSICNVTHKLEDSGYLLLKVPCEWLVMACYVYDGLWVLHHPCLMFMLICHVDLLCLSDKLPANVHLVTATDVMWCASHMQSVKLRAWLCIIITSMCLIRSYLKWLAYAPFISQRVSGSNTGSFNRRNVSF